MKKEEFDYRVKFCLKYFGKTGWKIETLNKVDVLLHTKSGRPLLYIESKERISSDGEERRKAIAQALLTNSRQDLPLGKVAILYYDTKYKRDMLELIECSDNAVTLCPEVKWELEKPSEPSPEAVYHLNNRVAGRITSFKGEDEIRSFYKDIIKSGKTAITITARNSILIYNQWKAEVKFKRYIHEQTLIDLFLADMINNEKYTVKQRDDFFERPLEREGTNLGLYKVQDDGIAYKQDWYEFADKKAHDNFWKRYHRPPEYQELLIIKEHSNQLYSEEYRKDNGQEYTPPEFVTLQNELIRQHYNLDDFIVFDPCAGVGNLENQFGRDFKENCYLSTLLDGDVDQCRLKDFHNSVKYDYLQNKQQPKFPYKGEEKTIDEIAALEGKRLMVVMNPPFVKPEKGQRYDKCLRFFRKVLDVKPDVIVLYCKTEFFFRAETNKVFAGSGYKVQEHVSSNAKTTFKQKVWPVSLVIFDREQGFDVCLAHTPVKRYELKNGVMKHEGSYDYDNERPCLIDEYESAIKSSAYGLLLGQWVVDHYCIIVSNKHTTNHHITTANLGLALALKGINFNTHPKYYETSDYIFRGHVSDVSKEITDDAIILALFYKGNNFSNKDGAKNYLMPFTADELGCGCNQLYELSPKNELSIPFPDGETENRRFNFREWMKDVQMSSEGKAVYDSALAIVRYYHNHPAYANGRDWNDSFFDIKSAIMEKPAAAYQMRDNVSSRAMTRVKTAKGVKGFSKVNVRKVTSEEYWPMFDRYFDAMDVLAKKIIRRMVETGLLLWHPSNIK